jgi:heat shock protein HtpX
LASIGLTGWFTGSSIAAMLARRALTPAAIRADVPVRMAQKSVHRMQWAALAAGMVLLAAAVPSSVIADDAGGPRRLAGVAGIAILLLWAGSHALVLLRATARAALPRSVGRTPVEIAPARGYAAGTFAVALALPIGALAVLLALVEWTWLPVALVLVLGGVIAMVGTVQAREDTDRYASDAPEAAREVLERLCMRADIAVPELREAWSPVPNAWTSGGRISVTSALLHLLDRHELEAVLAHEVAHLARRDAAVIEICSAPSTLGFSYLGGLRTVGFVGLGAGQLVLGLWVMAWLCVPPALLLAGLSRLSMLGSSRAREYAADAAASALTGRPSALASALLKLEAEREWAPPEDLRGVSALCIVGTGRRLLGGLLSTHPPTERRVRRLELIEREIR